MRPWMVERSSVDAREDLETADIPSTMVVGVHRPADETQRLHEYSPPLDRTGSRRTRSSSSARSVDG